MHIKDRSVTYFLCTCFTVVPVSLPIFTSGIHATPPVTPKEFLEMLLQWLYTMSPVLLLHRCLGHTLLHVTYQQRLPYWSLSVFVFPYNYTLATFARRRTKSVIRNKKVKKGRSTNFWTWLISKTEISGTFTNNQLLIYNI